MVTGPALGPATCWAAAEQKELDMTENRAGKQQADSGATILDAETPAKKKQRVGEDGEDAEPEGNVREDRSEESDPDDGQNEFTYPDGLCVDPHGNIFVADGGSHRIVRLDGSDAACLCYAGGDGDGFQEGVTGDALFRSPTGVAVAPSGDLIVSDSENNAIRKISVGQVSTVAGCREEGFRDGPAAQAMFNCPTALVCDQQGSIYVVDVGNHCIRKIANGIVSTFAGSEQKGHKDGAGSMAQFRHPGGIAIDKEGTVFVADFGNHRIRSISPAGEVKTLAGSGKKGHRDGAGLSAAFSFPMGLAVNPVTGDLVVADYGNQRIRLISPRGIVSTLAGTGKSGFKDGPLSTATFNQPCGVACDTGGRVYVVDRGNHAVREISDMHVKTIAGPTHKKIVGLDMPVQTSPDDNEADRASSDRESPRDSKERVTENELDDESLDNGSSNDSDLGSYSEAGHHGVCLDCGHEGEIIVEPGEMLDAEWWDARFRSDIKEGTNSEWIMSYDGVAHFMLPHLDASGVTLVVGYGNSDFSGRMCAEAGFIDIVNTDISKVVIDHMREIHTENKAMTWVVDDAVSMAFDDCSFDQIVDKSLLDCMCHCEDKQFEGCVNDFVRECHRVLRPGGVAIFATKETQDDLAKRMPCAGPLESRWCDLDWTIARQIVYAPKGDMKAAAVTEASLLPADCEVFDTIFIFTAVKGGQVGDSRGMGGKQENGRGGTLRRG